MMPRRFTLICQDREFLPNTEFQNKLRAKISFQKGKRRPNGYGDEPEDGCYVLFESLPHKEPNAIPDRIYHVILARAFWEQDGRELREAEDTALNSWIKSLGPDGKDKKELTFEEVKPWIRLGFTDLTIEELKKKMSHLDRKWLNFSMAEVY